MGGGPLIRTSRTDRVRAALRTSKTPVTVEQVHALVPEEPLEGVKKALYELVKRDEAALVPIYSEDGRTADPGYIMRSRL